MIIAWPKGFGPYIVMAIGCLECYHSSAYLGHFPTVTAAKTAHPSALTYKEQSDKGWRGEGVQVIYDLRKEQTYDRDAC